MGILKLYLIVLVLLSSLLTGLSEPQLLRPLSKWITSARQLAFNGQSRYICTHDLPSPKLNWNETDYTSCFREASRARSSRHPDQDLRVDKLVLKYKYSLVTYTNITTRDQYVLTVFRIKGSPKSPPSNGKPAIMLLHGLATASDIWVLQNDFEKSLAIKLVNAGYDVWLVNARGTTYSNRHVKLDPKSNLEYWSFSQHEQGIYDIPAVLELMLKETGNEKISFVCHSMGCAAYSIALSEYPQLNTKFHGAFFMAPAIFFSHCYSPLRALFMIVQARPSLQNFMNFAVRGRFDAGSTMTSMAQSLFCTPKALRCGFCGNILYMIYGFDAPQLNYTHIPNIVSKFSNTQSFKTLIHLSQQYYSCSFQKYDYGFNQNFRLYGQGTPPSYRLDKISTPIYMYYSESDNFVPPIDMEQARDAFQPGTVKEFYKVPWKLFNHVDFVYAENADVLVYDKIIRSLNQIVE